MAITGAVKKCIDLFKKGNPNVKGKINFTSGARTKEKQLSIILEPRNLKSPKNYSTMKKNYKKIFNEDLDVESKIKKNKENYDWCIKYIWDRRGSTTGFAHVGGNAQDIGVSGLTNDEKSALEIHLAASGFAVIYEYVKGEISKFHVDIAQANTFHVHVGPKPRLIA